MFHRQMHQSAACALACSQQKSYSLKASSSVKWRKGTLFNLCLKWANVYLQPPSMSAKEAKAHWRGVIMNGPFLNFIIFVETPKGRTDTTSILSLFSAYIILEQISKDRLVELQTPSLDDRNTPVHEAILRIALLQVLVRILETRMRLMTKRARRSTLISSTSISGAMPKQGPPATDPALFTTIPISRSFHCSKIFSRRLIQSLSAMLQEAYLI